MRFELRCVIARVEDDAEARRVATAMVEVLPAFVTVRRFAAPFSGVIGGHAPDDAGGEPRSTVADAMARLSEKLEALPVVYVDVDCFGGTCLYEGQVWRHGVAVHAEPRSDSAHVRLLAHLGARHPEWYFAPFTRGFLRQNP